MARLKLRISLGQWLWLSVVVFRKPGTFYFLMNGSRLVGRRDFQFLVYISEGYGGES